MAVQAAKHYGIAAAFPTPLSTNDDGDFVLQYVSRRDPCDLAASVRHGNVQEACVRRMHRLLACVCE
jgi:hypothetical protein